MKEVKILDLIKDGKRAKLTHAIAGCLYYRIYLDNGEVWQFCVDMNDKNDVGTATFLNDEKAIMLNRYIRKSKESGDLVQLR